MTEILLNERETKAVFFESIAFIITELMSDSRAGDSLEDNWGFFEYIYQPDDRLRKRLADYEAWYITKTGENAGQLMEEIAYLSFCCLNGHDTIKSGQSDSSQHDLIVSGSTPNWIMLMALLHLPIQGRTILIEAKNTAEKVDDAHFSRLCFIMENKFPTLCHLGVFFTREGATSFPENGDLQQRSLRDTRSTQALFHAKTNKFVVVFAHEQILRLGEVGSLPRMMEGLIREVENRFGQTVQFDQEWNEKDILPPHMLKYSHNP